ncbi:hypothetical protein QBC46DRAFT_372129 [Diplogelasinospora grovesii]|uniref:Uncharacterized protein n=1 Tax=Diplogelasinospora grovesii TaxID=303347 RepID=A0AAN6NGL7_9PEZI|nr:hypothetical protein QBC46DRAFT_372129 [Diplogelasinospora grovesii]
MTSSRKPPKPLQYVPFKDDTLMSDDPPSCAWADFETPRLRKCPFDLSTVSWKKAKLLGYGMDGCVWRVNFGDQGPFAIKVFWDTKPQMGYCYTVQRECQNNALLQMIEAALQAAPIRVNENPKEKQDALANLFSFSDEARQDGVQHAKGSSLREMPPFPRMAKCYGWLDFDRQEFRKMPQRIQVDRVHIGRDIRKFSEKDNSYIAIVYEYIEDGPNDPATVNEVSTFLWLAGFNYGASQRAENWKQGILVDHSDIVHPDGCGWSPGVYRLRNGKLTLPAHHLAPLRGE